MAAVRQLPMRVSIGEMLRRALRLRCPRCGVGRLFAGRFTMHETCEHCGFRFEREPGYFVGAIYVNYAVTSVVCLGGAVALDVLLGIALWMQLVVAGTLAVLVPVVFFRYARSLWLGIEHLVTTADETMERRRRRMQ